MDDALRWGPAVNRARRVAPGTPTAPAIRRAIGDLAAAIVRMGAMDPVITEIVRMQCARHHDCGT
jgi:hypothetical protein